MWRAGPSCPPRPETPCWTSNLVGTRQPSGLSPPCHQRPQECPCGPGQEHCLVTVHSLPPHLTCSLSLSDSASVGLYDLASLPSLTFCESLSPQSPPASTGAAGASHLRIGWPMGLCFWLSAWVLPAPAGDVSPPQAPPPR